MSDDELAGPSVAVCAYFCAVLAGSVTGAVLLQYGFTRHPEVTVAELTSLGFVTLVFAVIGSVSAAPLAPILVFVIRRLRLVRPWADIGGGALVAALSPLVFQLTFFAGSDIAMMLWMLPWTLASVSVAGWVYWLVSGRPSAVRHGGR